MLKNPKRVQKSVRTQKPVIDPGQGKGRARCSVSPHLSHDYMTYTITESKYVQEHLVLWTLAEILKKTSQRKPSENFHSTFI